MLTYPSLSSGSTNVTTFVKYIYKKNIYAAFTPIFLIKLSAGSNTTRDYVFLIRTTTKLSIMILLSLISTKGIIFISCLPRRKDGSCHIIWKIC